MADQIFSQWVDTASVNFIKSHTATAGGASVFLPCVEQQGMADRLYHRNRTTEKAAGKRRNIPGCEAFGSLPGVSGVESLS
jgi:hypothetical protein